MPYTDEQILTLAPFSVILMMSLVDGGSPYNIERAIRFLGNLDEARFENSSPLLRVKIAQLLTDVDLIAEVLQNNPIDIIAPLGRLRKILDERVPDDAERFCQELIALARFAATFDHPDGSAELTVNEMKYETFLNIMLLDKDPIAREETATIIEFLCHALRKGLGDNLPWNPNQ